MCPLHRSLLHRLVVFVAATGALLSCSFHNPYRIYSGDDIGAISDQTCRGGEDFDAVRWVELEDTIEQEIVTLWCATVGPAAVRDFRTTEPGSADSLVIISWNVHVGGGDVTGLVSRLRSGALTGAPVDRFVLLLQETHRAGADVPRRNEDFIPSRIEEWPPEGPRLDAVALAEHLGLALFYVPAMRNGPVRSGDTEEDRGNAILSTERLRDLTAIELPFERVRRVPVVATVSGATTTGREWTLRIANVHLSNRSQLSYHFGSAGMVGRMRQARSLCRAVVEAPAVVAGDFNAWGPAAVERSIHIVQESFPLPEELDRRPTFAARFAPDRRIDYFFFRPGEGESADYRRLDERYGSDHYPLLATVRFGLN